VAALVSTVITQTIADRLKSSGFVKPAIASSTNWASVAKAADDSVQASATRFLYCPKASKADRDEGLDQFDPQAFVQFQTGNGESGSASSLSEGRETQYRNIHPTVKPTALMRYLVRLVTPVGGTVLDPFTGSGSTGKAAILEGRSFIGCELTEAYVPIARARIAAAIASAYPAPQPITASETVIPASVTQADLFGEAA
jgi:site-specific DNA-methyltransferase (adenine-specific)